MCSLYFSTVFIITSFVFLLSLDNSQISAAENIVRQFDNCGQLNPIQNDIRTISPWSVAIFKFAKGEKSPRFLTTGFIISPSLVVSVLGGPVGMSRGFKTTDRNKNWNTKKSNHLTANIFIAAGINTTDFSGHDSFAQYAQVTLIESFRQDDPTNIYNHVVLYHLATPLNLLTPYVRKLCLQLYLTRKDLKISPSMIFNYDHIQTGFARKLQANSSEPWILTAWKVTGGPSSRCQSFYRYYYKRDELTFCTTRNFNTKSLDVTFTKIVDTIFDAPTKLQAIAKANRDVDMCQSHGSFCLTGLGDTWFLTTLVTQIPSRRRNRCGPKSVYFAGIVNYQIYYQLFEWLYFSTRCRHNEFSCGDGLTCIPLSKVCDGIVDCSSQADEHYSLCDTQETVIKKVTTLTSSRDYIFCPPISNITTNGTKIQCFDSTSGGGAVDCNLKKVSVVGKRIKVECDGKHKVPAFAYQSLDLLCGADGQWQGVRPFYCERECGIIQDAEKPHLPWQSIILKDGVTICEATLIEENFLLTATSCVSEWLRATTIAQKSKFTVMFQGGRYRQLAECLHSGQNYCFLFDIRNVWTAKDPLNPNMVRSIAIIQINVKNDLEIPTAACYLQPPPTGLSKAQMISQLSTVLAPVNVEILDREKCDEEERGHRHPSRQTQVCVSVNTKRDNDVRVGSGYFTHFSPNTNGSITKHALEGIVVRKVTNKMAVVEPLDDHEDWILDILENES